LKPSKEQLEKGLWGNYERNECLRLQIDSKKTFLALIVKAKALTLSM
jgi:hypothetical protein